MTDKEFIDQLYISYFQGAWMRDDDVDYDRELAQFGKGVRSILEDRNLFLRVLAEEKRIHLSKDERYSIATPEEINNALGFPRRAS